MPQRIASRTVYATSDGQLVDEGHADAAYLVAREGAAIDEAWAQRLGVDAARIDGTDATAYDARADHAAKHGGDTQAAADGKRARMFEGVADPDGAPAEGERADLGSEAPANEAKAAGEPAATKAVSKAPENKAK